MLWTLKPWPLRTELDYPRNLSGCLALDESVSARTVFGKNRQLLSSPPSMPPSPHTLTVARLHLYTQARPTVINLLSPLSPWEGL